MDLSEIENILKRQFDRNQEQIERRFELYMNMRAERFDTVCAAIESRYESIKRGHELLDQLNQLIALLPSERNQNQNQ